MLPNTTRFRARPQVEALEPRWQPSVSPIPAYTSTFTDALTADNAFQGRDGNQYWTIDAGADQYRNDVYERPTAQTYRIRHASDGSKRFAASEYYANLDIVEARAGFDSNFLYVSIKMAGLTHSKSDWSSVTEGLIYQYGFRLAREADGGGGLLIVADQPGLKNNPSTEFASVGTFIYSDANGDVGGRGRTVTKSDRWSEAFGNGYEQVLASDGMIPSGERVLWVRVNPNDPTVVEFALDYKAVGFTEADLGTLPYLEFEANKGLQGPSNYAWNDHYSRSQAGSPYRGTWCNWGRSIFGTQGLGNIYEVDTLSGGPIDSLPPSPTGGSLAGHLFNDADGDGQFTTGEGLSGVRITLSGLDVNGDTLTFNVDGTIVEDWTITTNGDGSYDFGGLVEGTYFLMVIPLASGDRFEPTGGTTSDESTFDGDLVTDNYLGIVLSLDETGVDFDFRLM